MSKFILTASAIALLVGGASNAIAGSDAAEIFKAKCAMCHSLDQKKVGPAVKDMNADASVLRTTITDGRKMMPKFGGKLSAEEIDALVAYIQAQR